MKTSVKRVILAILIFTFIGTASVFAAQEKTADGELVKAGSLKLNTGEYMTAKTLNYESTKKADGTWISTEGGSAYTIYSVAAKATGRMFVDAYADSANQYGTTVIIGTYDGSQIHYYASESGYVSAGAAEYGIGSFDVKAGKTYYIGVQSSAAANIYVSPYVIPYSARKLNAGKTMLVCGYKSNPKTDSLAKVKIKPTKTGYITVSLKEYGYSSAYGSVTLLNSKKKAVSEKLSYSSGSSYSYVVFGVKKGATYYLKATGLQGSKDNGYAYGIKYTIKSAALKKNTSKGKAVTLKRKAKAKTMARPATGKSMKQWYKFKVPKKQTTILQLDARKIKSGTAKITIYCGSKKVATQTVSNGYSTKYTITHSTTYGKANKGTYYAVISSNAKCNGMYKIRYVK